VKQKKKYPEVVETHNRWEYVDGSEYLLKMKHNSLVAVTHGLFLKTFFKEMMNTDIKKVGDGGFVLLEETDGKFKILKEDGIEYE
jgi:hypothetical protein